MRTFALRLRSLFRRNRVERELDAELQFHLEHKIEEGIVRGLSPEQARREALLALGGVEQVKEECRDRRRVNFVEHLFQDLGYALRNLRKNPGFAAVAILTLALGIGANTALFSLVNAVLLKNLPVRDPERLYFVDNVGATGRPNGAPPYPCFELIRDGSHSFEGMAAFSGDTLNLTIDGPAEQVYGQFVSGSYFQVLGVTPVAGRMMTPGDERLDPPVAVIGYSYWQRRFGGDAAVIGRVIRYQERSVTIVGVTPPDFLGIQPGARTDVTIPITMQDPLLLHERQSWWFNIVARLKPGVAPAQARSEVDPIFKRFMADATFPAAEIRKEFFDHMDLLPASQGMDQLRQRLSRPLTVLMGIVGLVLLIGCANLANLLMARASGRRREFAVRLAMGAGHGRLVRQLLTETLLLFSCGAAVGLAVARGGVQLLVGFFTLGRSPIRLEAPLDLRVMAFTVSLTILTGVLFGLAPALGAVRIDPYRAIQDAGVRSTASRTSIGLRQLLVVGQVTLSLVLVVAAGLFVRTLMNLDKLDPGFRPEHVITLSVEPLGTEYRNKEHILPFWSRVLTEARRIPGVQSASLSHLTPLSGRNRGVLIKVPGFEPRSDHDREISLNHVSDGYFETLGIPVMHGRNFTADDVEPAPRVAILNEAAAKFYFGDRDPLGTKVEFRSAKGFDVYEVVGVVSDTKHMNLREAAPRFVYLPVFQPRDSSTRLTLTVKAAGDPSALLATVQKRVRGLGPNVLVTEAMLLQEQMDATLVQERLLSVLSGFFGILALLLSAIGLYGVLAQAVHQKTNEIGIRIALGARGGQVVWMVLNRSIALVGIGVALGVPAALLAIRPLKSLLFGLPATDAPTILVGAGILLATAALASYLPARRAARVDPMIALRYE